MKADIKQFSQTIANLLDLSEKVVMLWVKSNKYGSQQLKVLAKQICQETVYLATLITCIKTNNTYRISIY